jgi:hypothetical protein
LHQGGFRSVEYVLAIAEQSLADPLGELQNRLFVSMLVVEYQEALHMRTLQQVTFDARPERRRLPTCHRRRPQMTMRAPVARWRITLSLIGPAVLSKYVRALWQAAGQRPLDVFIGLVIDRDIVAEQLAT